MWEVFWRLGPSVGFASNINSHTTITNQCFQFIIIFCPPISSGVLCLKCLDYFFPPLTFKNQGNAVIFIFCLSKLGNRLGTKGSQCSLTHTVCVCVCDLCFPFVYRDGIPILWLGSTCGVIKTFLVASGWAHVDSKKAAVKFRKFEVKQLVWFRYKS